MSKRLTSKQKAKRSLLRKQRTQLKRLAEIANAMEKQGYTFKSTELNKIFKVSSERASEKQMQARLDILKSTHKADLYNAVKSFQYTSETGKAVTAKGEEAVKVGKAKTRKKKRVIIETPIPVDITDEANDALLEFIGADVLLNERTHNHNNALYGEIVSIGQTSLGKLLLDAWEEVKPAWSKARGNEGKDIFQRCTTIINAIRTAPYFPSINGYKGDAFTRSANIIYREITLKSLPAEYSEISEDISPIGTPWESEFDYDE